MQQRWGGDSPIVSPGVSLRSMNNIYIYIYIVSEFIVFIYIERSCHTMPHAATHCRTLQHCRTLPHTVALPRTAAHCRTLPHSRTAAHCRAHCHTLSRTLSHIAARTARTLRSRLPHIVAHSARTAALQYDAVDPAWPAALHI
jgi:hypothetical protein